MAGQDGGTDATDGPMDMSQDMSHADTAPDTSHEDGGVGDVHLPDGGIFVNGCSPVHWTATASTTLNGMNYPANVFDGALNTRWTTGADQVPGQYLQIDFGSTVTLTQVVLDGTDQAGDYPRGYDVSISANGTTFTSVKTGTPAAGAIVTITFAAPVTGRAIRITQTGTGATWWSVDEVRLGCTVPGYSPDAGLVDPYDPASWKATASVSQATAALAIDGDPTTRWSTGAAQAGGETFTLDLGAPAIASELWLDANAATDSPAMYELRISTDGVTFPTAATVMGASGAVNVLKITFPRQVARAFRIKQTGTSTHYWSIYGITLVP
jgi:hypothetical protein